MALSEQAVVLESDMFSAAKGSAWEDSEQAYPFPARYLGQLEPLVAGDEMVALIYEPRGDANVGRMAYVAWTTLDRAPIDVGDNWAIPFTEEPFQFERAILREINGIPLESWLADIPRGRPRNVATVGRAVRQIPISEAVRIVGLGTGTEPDVESTNGAGADGDTNIDATNRAKVITRRIERDTKFRREVVRAYGGRCAISGWGDGSKGVGLDAAHIRPAGSGHNGPDTVHNGICLTPTLHRLFDLGFFTIEPKPTGMIVRLASRTPKGLLESAEQSAVLPLRSGQHIRLPERPGDRPNPECLVYHKQNIYNKFA